MGAAPDPRARASAFQEVTMPAILWSALAPILACPVCDTGTGREVRAGILGGDLVVTLLAVTLPFTLVAAVVAFVHFGRSK
jgi:hypothetical protein